MEGLALKQAQARSVRMLNHIKLVINWETWPTFTVMGRTDIIRVLSLLYIYTTDLNVQVYMLN